MSSPLPSPEMHVDWRDFGRALVQWLSTKQPDPPQMPRMKQAQLPAGRARIGMIIYCTDITNPEPVHWDGTNWIRFSDRTAI